MISGRRAAREAALLVLFATDARNHKTIADVDEPLATFREHLRADPEVIADLFGDDDEEEVPAGLVRRAGRGGVDEARQRRACLEDAHVTGGSQVQITDYEHRLHAGLL